EISGPSPPSIFIRRPRAKVAFRDYGLFPIPVGHTRTFQPDFTNLSIGAWATDKRVDDTHLSVQQRRTATDQRCRRGAVISARTRRFQALARESDRIFVEATAHKKRVLC